MRYHQEKNGMWHICILSMNRLGQTIMQMIFFAETVLLLKLLTSSLKLDGWHKIYWIMELKTIPMPENSIYFFFSYLR